MAATADTTRPLRADARRNREKIVDAAPPHMNDPAGPTLALRRGPSPTATVRPKPEPSNPTSP